MYVGDGDIGVLSEERFSLEFWYGKGALWLTWFFLNFIKWSDWEVGSQCSGRSLPIVLFIKKKTAHFYHT